MKDRSPALAPGSPPILVAAEAFASPRGLPGDRSDPLTAGADQSPPRDKSCVCDDPGAAAGSVRTEGPPFLALCMDLCPKDPPPAAPPGASPSEQGSLPCREKAGTHSCWDTHSGLTAWRRPGTLTSPSPRQHPRPHGLQPPDPWRACRPSPTPHSLLTYLRTSTVYLHPFPHSAAPTVWHSSGLGSHSTEHSTRGS